MAWGTCVAYAGVCVSYKWRGVVYDDARKRKMGQMNKQVKEDDEQKRNTHALRLVVGQADRKGRHMRKILSPGRERTARGSVLM